MRTHNFTYLVRGPLADITILWLAAPNIGCTVPRLQCILDSRVLLKFPSCFRSQLTVSVHCRCQAVIWTNARILLFGPLGTNFSEILIKIHTFSFVQKTYLKMSSAKSWPFYLGLTVLITLVNIEPNCIAGRFVIPGSNQYLYTIMLHIISLGKL